MMSGVDDELEVQLKVEGMVCDGCSTRVEEALKKLDGIGSVKVDLESGLVDLNVKAATQMDAVNRLEELCGVVSELGFECQPNL